MDDATNQLHIIDAVTNTITGTVPVAPGASMVALSPDGTRAWVSSRDSSVMTTFLTAPRDGPEVRGPRRGRRDDPNSQDDEDALAEVIGGLEGEDDPDIAARARHAASDIMDVPDGSSSGLRSVEGPPAP